MTAWIQVSTSNHVCTQGDTGSGFNPFTAAASHCAGVVDVEQDEPGGAEVLAASPWVPCLAARTPAPGGTSRRWSLTSDFPEAGCSLDLSRFLSFLAFRFNRLSLSSSDELVPIP